jgi:hypothetical protein
MDYLFSGVPPEQWKSLTFELKKKDGQWKLFAKGDERALKGLYFKTNVTSFLGIQKIVGIKTVEYQREN